ncbi:MAG TPA: hypothetical protein VGF32_28325 [Streptosporangiaceae bacterium]
MTARRARRRLALTDDGIIDPIAIQIAARGTRTIALTRAERRLAAARILARGGTRTRRRRPRATAARQALGLCEAELVRLAWDGADAPRGSHVQPRIRVITTRAALRATGVPPHIAAALRRRLRLTPEQAAE